MDGNLPVRHSFPVSGEMDQNASRTCAPCMPGRGDHGATENDAGEATARSSRTAPVLEHTTSVPIAGQIPQSVPFEELAT